MPSEMLVLKGGTLIDGTGRPPIENSVIVIDSGRFKTIGKGSDIPIPLDATVVDLSGKTVLPGFIDGHAHLEEFHGELYLHLGITTVAQIEIYQDGPWSRAQKGGTNLGKIRGPRIWMSGIAIGGARGMHDAFGSRTSRGFRVVTSEEETRRVVRRKKEWGYDCIKINEYLPFELAKATCDEAHRHNMAVAAHSLDAMESARAGVDAIEHIWSVGYSSIPYPPARRKLAEDRLSGKIEQELAGAYYQTENFDRVIDAMVGSNVAWTPTIAKWLRPLSPSAERFRKREREILDNPKANLPDAVRVVTDNAYDKLFRRYTPEQLDMAKIGFEKANEFIYKFVKAGGLLKEGSDPPRGMAALLLHEALVMDVEAGVPPMAAIQAATLNVAKTFKMEKNYGSVEVGKVADLCIVEGNPLEDIWTTQNVKMVVMDGKVIDHGFTNYQNPIPSFYSNQSLPPDIQISPLFLHEGDGPTVLTVKSKEMWPFHTVMLNGRPLPTTFLSKDQLQATIPSDAIAKAGTYFVTIKSNGERLPESNRAHLTVGFKV
jgi:hypothetical protein